MRYFMMKWFWACSWLWLRKSCFSFALSKSLSSPLVIHSYLARNQHAYQLMVMVVVSTSFAPSWLDEPCRRGGKGGPWFFQVHCILKQSCSLILLVPSQEKSNVVPHWESSCCTKDLMAYHRYFMMHWECYVMTWLISLSGYIFVIIIGIYPVKK